MLKKDDLCLMMIDFQDKLIKVVSKTSLVDKALILLKGAQLMKIPYLITEQHPKGLGKTDKRLTECLSDQKMIFEKECFSAMKSVKVETFLMKVSCKQILLCGLETHICVFQTALDLIHKGHEVFLIQDISASRSKDDESIALSYLRSEGVHIVTLEMVLYDLLKTAEHPLFKKIHSEIV